jgi:hypothetical protein
MMLIKLSDDRIVNIKVYPNDKCYDVKKKIQEITGIKVENQKMLISDKMIQDDELIYDKSNIYIMIISDPIDIVF